MHNKHPHHTLFLVAFVPFVLLFASLSVTHAFLEPQSLEYEELSLRAFQKLQLLDGEFLNLQKAYTLLTRGEEKIITPSELTLHFGESFPSPLTEHAALKERIADLRTAIENMHARMAQFGTKAIHIDLSDQRVRLIERGLIVSTFSVSSGAADTPTPVGTFAIRRKQELRVSNLETPYRMPFYMAFTKDQGFGLHALPYLGSSAAHSDYWHEARSHIGIPVSHGCVRFLPEEAEEIYKWADVGTPVYIRT